MHALDFLADPVRRRILELLADGELPAGEVSAIVQREFGITQPAVSLHLRILRDNGFVSVRPVGARRLYKVDPGPLREVDTWLNQYRHIWSRQADTLLPEIAPSRVRVPTVSAGVPAPEPRKKKRKHRKGKRH